MNIVEYEKMSKMEDEYWWHVGRLAIFDKQLEKLSSKKKLKILNIGCGTGGTVRMLEKHGDVTNVDISDEAIKYMKEKGFPNVIKVDGIKLPFEDNTFDLVASFDVLEHIEEDVEALEEWRRVLKPQGHIIVSVPAYKWLWSQHDVSLHHHRRYTSQSLKASAVAAGLKNKRLSYAISFSLPLVAGFRLLNKALGRKMDAETSYVAVPPQVNKAFIKLLKAESRAQKVLRFPFGTTVLGQFTKDS